jgi:VanZ family protein
MSSIKSFFNSYAPAVLWWLIVLVLICTPGQALPKLGSWADLVSLDKIIHVIIFAFMGYFFMRPVALTNRSIKEKRNIFIKITLAIALWGLTTEYIQEFWVINRTFDVYDSVADAAGALVAFFYGNRYLLR